MCSRAARKDLDGRSGSNTFHRKLQIEKTAIETDYGRKPGFCFSFFSDNGFFSRYEIVAPKFF
jgi:hypothetical protein